MMMKMIFINNSYGVKERVKATQGKVKGAKEMHFMFRN